MYSSVSSSYSVSTSLILLSNDAILASKAFTKLTFSDAGVASKTLLKTFFLWYLSLPGKINGLSS